MFEILPMLSVKNRLVKKKDFDIIFTKGKTVKNGFLIFKILKSHFKNSRFGFVVSKKVSPRAVVRNRVKRELRAVVLDIIKDIKNPIDVIIVALPASKEKSFLEFKEIITKCLHF